VYAMPLSSRTASRRQSHRPKSEVFVRDDDQLNDI
jgi:hypothetical protein